MNRLRIRHRMQHAAKPAVRLESDREVLRFPEGGVFGCCARKTSESDDVIAGVERVLDRMQAQLDELSEDVDRVFHLPRPAPSNDDDWQPPSAA